MGIKIDWTELSSNQLINIYNYYSIKASPRIAKKIINKIIDRVEVLCKYPLSGTKEKLLFERAEDFRYLIESNYKIIYWQEEKIITIASVFDSRPESRKDERNITSQSFYI